MGSGAFKFRREEISVNCYPFISAGDFNDNIRQYKEQLSPTELDCLKQARELLKNYPMEVWKNAEFYVQIPEHPFIFWSGKRKNKFISYPADDGKIVSYFEQGPETIDVTAAVHRAKAKMIQCNDYISASDFNVYLQDHDGDLSAEEKALLRRARNELKNHPVHLWTDAEFYIQCESQDRSFCFRAGKPKNKFICFKSADDEYSAYLEQGGDKPKKGGKMAAQLGGAVAAGALKGVTSAAIHNLAT